MKKKSKGRKKAAVYRLFHICFWLVILAGGLWVAFAPKPPRYHAQNVRVKVEPPRPEITPQEVPPEASTVVTEEEKTQKETTSAALPSPRVHLGPKPMIAIIIDDMGLDLKDSKRAINLPAAITLSFIPYATRLREQTLEAREQGHELLLHMPMEPVGHDNPGPGALLVDLSPDEQRQRFVTALASFTGFDGVNNHMGSKFTADESGMEMIIDELKQRGLFFFDSRTSPKTIGEKIAREQGVPAIGRDVFLDDTIAASAIRAQLRRTEQIARRKGYAVAIGHPHVTTLEVLEQWIPQAEAEGFELIPINGLLK